VRAQRWSVVSRVWIVFLLAFAALTAAWVGIKPWVAPLAARGTAQATAWCLWLLGAEGRAHGTLVTSSIFSFEIVDTCTGADPIMVFVAAVLALPAGWSRRLKGLTWGVVSLLAINQLRLVSLCYIGHWYPEAFDAAHLLAWQGLLILATVGLWLAYASGTGPAR